MEKNCNNCKNSKITPCVCIDSDKWTFKPSDMDLLALESLRTGGEVYTEGGKKIAITGINKTNYLGIGEDYYHPNYIISEIYAEKPCTDLTKEEVKEHLFEKVWMWDGMDPEQRELVGYKENKSYPYRTEKNKFAHASLTKPNL